MTRAEALRSVIDSLNAEIAALKALDLDALVAATATKETGIARLAGADEPVTEEVRALAQEAAALNETARVFVNLMSANVRRRLEAITGAAPASYRPQGLAAVA